MVNETDNLEISGEIGVDASGRITFRVSINPALLERASVVQDRRAKLTEELLPREYVEAVHPEAAKVPDKQPVESSDIAAQVERVRDLVEAQKAKDAAMTEPPAQDDDFRSAIPLPHYTPPSDEAYAAAVGIAAERTQDVLMRGRAARDALQRLQRPAPPAEDWGTSETQKKKIILHRRTRAEVARDRALGISDAEARRRWKEQHIEREAVGSSLAEVDADGDDARQLPRVQDDEDQNHHLTEHTEHEAVASSLDRKETQADGTDEQPPRVLDETLELLDSEAGSGICMTDESGPVGHDGDVMTTPEYRGPKIDPAVSGWWDKAVRSNGQKPAYVFWKEDPVDVRRSTLISLAEGAPDLDGLEKFVSANDPNINYIRDHSETAANDVLAAIAKRRAELGRGTSA